VPRISFSDVIAELAHVDDPDILERASGNSAARIALEMSRPQNWWGIAADPNVLFEMARDDGIPVAWVPRGAILSELASAGGGPPRRQVLLERQEEIVADCRETLGACKDPWLGDHVILAETAVVAFLAGHFQAAMALAVSIGDPLAKWASTERVRAFDSETDKTKWEKHRKKISEYAWAEYELASVGVDVRRYRFKHQVLIAPIPRFFTPWFPDRGTQPPELLSRHVVAHRPTPAHFSVENALVSLMLVASILREQQAWSEEVRSMDAGYE
jgi:hypothetical protein